MTFDLHAYPYTNEDQTPHIETMYVSEVMDVPFDAAGEALADLAGRTVTAGRYRLDIADVDVDHSIAPYQRIPAVLHMPGLLARTIHVDIELAPWSEDRTEIGISPSGRHFTLLPAVATEHYLRAAWALAERLSAELEGEPLAATA